ncbi:MAG: ferritin-like domain-containing protein, partial [Gemmatimonadaceae bacterium]
DSGAGTLDGLTRSTGRRDFLRMAALGGAGLALPALLAACSDQYSTGVPIGGGANAGVTLDFKDDFGVLNYAYALEQLEAAFYTQVIATPYTGMPSGETTLLTAIRDHEVIHRDFLAAALGAKKIANLSVNFTAINFTSRDSVLGAAKTFEDLGVAAYNGAGQIISSPLYLGLAGKIVSVEGRHAAAIRDVIAGSTGIAFADNTVVDDTTGLDRAFSPTTVLSMAGVYITTKISTSNLPTLVGLSS